MKQLALIVFVAAMTTLWSGGDIGVYLLLVFCGCWWVYGMDWSELNPDRRRAPEPVQRERRRRDYEVGR